MHIVIGWPPCGLYSHELATRVLNLCAMLRRRGQLESVLATLPSEDPEGSRWRVFALIESLTSAGVDTAGVLLSLGTLRAADLDECLSAGVKDFVFIEEGASAHTALRVVGESRLAKTREARVRVWLSDACRGSYQRHVAAWLSAFDFAVEVAPAPFDLAAPAAAPAPAGVSGGGALTGCEWLRSVVTVAHDGSVLPCPAHLPGRSPSVSAREPHVALTQILEWQGTGVGSALCLRCDHPVRFGVMDWLGARQVPGPALPPEERKYHDYVGRDAAEASAEELDQLIHELAQRIDRSRRFGSVP